MEWNKAKDIIIVFLVLLNIMLGVLLAINDKKYTLSMEQEKNIVDVLASNNISMYAKVLNRYEPMKSLEVEALAIDEARMKEAFLGTTAALMTEEGDVKSFEYAKQSIILYENKVIYENNKETDSMEMNPEKAVKLCDDYLITMGSMGKGYFLDLGPYQRDGEFIVEYRQKINNMMIYDNYFLFAVDDYGIRRVEYSNNMPVGYFPDTKEICSSDEALFSFLKAMQRESTQKPQRIIEKMDIVYYINPEDQNPDQASPYYRIYYTEVGDTDNHMRLCMVNAYTNTWRLI